MRQYYTLAKPGIIYGNAITAAAGFLLASRGSINFALLIFTLIGLSLIVGASCVFNNIYDRDIDKRMERTKKRALVKGEISIQYALIYGIILAILGAFALGKLVNILSFEVALVGMIFYVGLYTPLKRRSVYGTLIGSIAGATPPVVGYTAVTNHLDLGAFLLFWILITWQMPHFYSIAIRRLKDYKEAKIPVLPAVKGVFYTKIEILIYILGFIIATVLLSLLGYAGHVYLVLVSLIGLVWLGLAIKGFGVKDEVLWAKNMFLFSLVVTLFVSIVISADWVIH